MKSAICCDDRRRASLRRLTGEYGERTLNGLDYVEVEDDQRAINAYFLGKLPRHLRKDRDALLKHVRIEGGRRIRDVKVEGVEPRVDPDPERADYLTNYVNKPGDFSTYTLRLVDLPDIDARYDHADFSFKVNCPCVLDCVSGSACPPDTRAEPEINYLAKDYASFRQLILDRLALIMPAWQERHVPDMGITLVELLAYTGDYLSYYQDAVATEAYLDTARQRISVRRHARLVDYRLHEGCNARAWVSVATDTNFSYLGSEFFFVTRLQDSRAANRAWLTAAELHALTDDSYEVFEPLVAEPDSSIQFQAAHSNINFYTWGEQECCLPRGATTATLKDHWIAAAEPVPNPPAARRGGEQPPPPEPSPFRRALNLRVGDVLIFEQVVDPKTGLVADADPTHRHAVRLTSVEQVEDPIFRQALAVGDNEYDLATPVVEIAWAEEDRLPFPFCLSALGPAPACRIIDPVSVARGNVVLVDNGRSLFPPERLGSVPVVRTEAVCEDACTPSDVMQVAGRFYPRLERKPLTFSQPLAADWAASAKRQLLQNAREALPQITLNDELPAPPSEEQQVEPARAVIMGVPTESFPWTPRLDLLASSGDDRHFVAEIDNEGVAHLRFGDGELGEQPVAGAVFYADYRIGNGVQGNVGAETIVHLITRTAPLSGVQLSVRNPLPAQGGVDPEPVAEAKLLAPSAFRQVLARAITGDDYARLAERSPLVARAAARLTWTGSWYEVDVAIDPINAGQADEELRNHVHAMLYPYRRVGHDLAVHPTNYVSLDIQLTVCVSPSYLRGHVKAALLDVFSNRALPEGKLGFFHPDRLTFGEGIYLSKLVAAAQAVSGVESVTVSRLQRQFATPDGEIRDGMLALSPLEIARLDNDPSFPEHGKLELIMMGGR
jgi:hypothetical protein